MTDSFPRQYARTQRLTLGAPRSLQISADGTRLLFARSAAGDDRANALWLLDLTTGRERKIADPATLLDTIDADDNDLPPEERARRERLREGGGGITSFSTDSTGERVVFALAGQLFGGSIDSIAHIPALGPVFDPRCSPSGDAIGFVSGTELRVCAFDGTTTTVASETGVSWASPDFIAAEEMGRYRGFWWSPESDRLAVCRVDESEVDTWHISNPAEPNQTPTATAYPAAGTTNPAVGLWIVERNGDRVEATWDHSAFPYLARVGWNQHGLVIVVQSRDQRTIEVRRVDTETGATSVLISDTDPDWVELVPGSPQLVGPDTVVWCADRAGARRLMFDDVAVSPADVQVRSIISATSDDVFVTGNPLTDATVTHIYHWTPTAFTQATSEPGVHAAVVGGPADQRVVAVRSATLAEPQPSWALSTGHTVASYAERPLVSPNVSIFAHSGDTPAVAVLLPHDHDGGPLPVLMDPYGGPHAQRVVHAHHAMCTSQWFADQGFAVVIADGRGTPGRGSDYERMVRDDLAGGVLDDQVTALEWAASHYPQLDMSRVGIRGWSFGGYLAALAVMDRPDVFHAGIAGAPVTEWRLYDTHYTERYLGDPTEQPDVYDASSLIPRADTLSRPLLLIHGLADDNVVAAHTLQLSTALLAAGKPHEVLPLVGVTHMTPQEVVAENLLLHQLEFLRRSLNIVKYD